MKILIILSLIFLGACASNPNKPESIETQVEQSQEIGQGRVIGLNSDGEMVTQKKTAMYVYLKDLQKEVYTLETQIYGDDQYGSAGQWGVLENCLIQSNSKSLGGDGTYVEMPPKARLTADEDKLNKMGVDENNVLVGVSEDYLKDRVDRFEKFKKIYQERTQWFDVEIKNCQIKLDNKKKTSEVK